MKKLFRTLIILIVIILVLGGGLMILISDSGEVDEKYKNYDKELDYETQKTISYSLMETRDTDIIDLSFTEESLNYMLAAVLNNAKANLSDFNIDGIQLSISENSDITANVFAKTSFISTVARGKVKLTSSDEGISLEISELGLGKIKVGKTLISSIMSLIISEKDLEDLLSSSGIKINVDLSEMTVTLKYEEVENSLKNIFKDDENIDIYSLFIDILFKNNLLTVVDHDSKVGLTLSVNKLSYNQTDFYEIPYSFNYEGVKENVEFLLVNNIINYKQTTYVFDYLVRGYDAIKDEEGYEFIPDLNLSSIGIFENRLYQGILNYEYETIPELLASQAPASLLEVLSSTFVVKLYEKSINDLLFKIGVAGISYAFAREENNTWKVSYIYIESIYSKIFNDYMDLVLTLNINGKHIAIKCRLNASDSNGLKVVTTVDEIRFGDIILSENQKISLLKYLNVATNEEEWIKIDVEEKKITFDFESYFGSNAMLSQVIEHSSSTSTQFVRDEKGYIKISINVSPF